MNPFKKQISLDFIIIFIGGFTVLMRDITKIYFFIIFFGFSLIYLYLDNRIFKANNKEKQKLFKLKFGLLILIVSFLITVTSVRHIINRHRQPNIWQVHDSQMQVEAAVKFILTGKNPYSQTYEKTEMGKIAAIMGTTIGQFLPNPALKHPIMLPFHFLISIPFYLISNSLLHFFDESMVYIFLLFVLLITIFSLPKKNEDKFILTSLFIFNPLFLNYFFEGRDDIVVLVWLVLVLFSLLKNKILLSSFFLALACTSKHSAFFIVPFYYLYLLLQNFQIQSLKDFIKKFKKICSVLLSKTWLFPLVFLIIILPFILMDPKSFYNDIFLFPAGVLKTSYPINGYGLSVLLLKLGVVKKVTDYLPLYLIQIPIVSIVLIFLIKQQLKNNNLSQVLFNYAIFIFIFWLTSRFFNDNYVGFISELMLIGYFIGEPRISNSKTKKLI